MKRTKATATFEQACAMYVHRFTMEYVPQWSRTAAPNGKFCAPQYRSDREWYERTTFPTDGRVKYCCSSDQTWPLGTFLDEPYRLEQR